MHELMNEVPAAEQTRLIEPIPSPCILCPTACWEVQYAVKRVGDSQVDTYSMTCFCLVKHLVVEDYPLMCSGNPGYVPEV